nr:methyltransferase domain-containing protein [Tessaracoccus coleopterorum]
MSGSRAPSRRRRTSCSIWPAGGRDDRAARAGGRTVIGVDRSESELAAAKDRGRGPLVLGHASYLPFADNSFDAVVTSLGIGVVADRPASCPRPPGCCAREGSSPRSRRRCVPPTSTTSG